MSEATVTPERHQQVSDLFSQLYELKPEQVRESLSRVSDPALRAEVEDLLRRHAEHRQFLESPPDLSGLIACPEPPGPPPKKFGRYTIRRVIATGGMGIVYEAEQEHPHRIVALKVLRKGIASPSAVRRFHVEAEMLARLDHPGIARVYDAGIHKDESVAGWGEEVPYFAMELVSGRSLLAYAAARSLSPEQRLDLMARVCDAVHHAHQHGIVHRDLKPANILVTDAGDPKILDFGVARASDADLWTTTLAGDSGMLLGTVPYMSPEQIEGRTADTRSDVYSLGIVLFELLSDRLPFDLADASIPEALRRLRQTPPIRLETLDRRFRGDVATIVSTAMEADPTRRYPSAAELAADLRRYLGLQPIQARAATAWYQARMFARRHTAAFTVAAIVAVLLTAAAAVSTILAIEASRQRFAAREAERRAEHELRDSMAVSGFLLDVFLGSPDESMLNRIELLDKAEAELNANPVVDPRVEAKLREYIGHGFMKLLYSPRAETHLVKALKIRRGLNTEDLDLAKSTHLLAMLRLSQGRVAEGQALLRETLAIRRRLYGPYHLTMHPDEELRFFVKFHLPDAAENAEDERIRRAIREQRPTAPPAISAAADDPVFSDEFDGDRISQDWTIETANAGEWRGVVAGSKLLVDRVSPAENHNRSPAVYLRRPFHAERDFFVTLRIGWAGADPERVAQSILLDVLGPGRRLVAKAGYSDVWVQWRGERYARIGQFGEIGRDVLIVRSGYDTLPGEGTAEVTIRRENDRICITWNGHTILQGECAEPVREISIDFVAVLYDGPEGTSQLGTMWVDRVAGFVGSEGPQAPKENEPKD